MAVLQGKVGLVTGAGSGIGQGTALAMAVEGARLVLGSRDEAAGRETERRIREAGGEALFLRTDVREEADVAALVALAVDTWGRLDLAFNNAGFAGPIGTPLHEHTLEDLEECLATNVRGTFLCIKHEIGPMLARGAGSIVNCSSINGLGGVLGGQAAYTSSKFAVEGLTRTAALDYAARGIRVNAVAPAGFVTPMLLQATAGQPERVAELLPMRRNGTLAEISAAVVWLLSDAASFVTGTTLPVDGGFLAR